MRGEEQKKNSTMLQIQATSAKRKANNQPAVAAALYPVPFSKQALSFALNP